VYAALFVGRLAGRDELLEIAMAALAGSHSRPTSACGLPHSEAGKRRLPS
jgi:hypothetical protein